MAKKKLTEREDAFLFEWRAFEDKHGESPSLQDLAELMGVSKATAYRHVKSLTTKGHLRRTKRPAGARGCWK